MTRDTLKANAIQKLESARALLSAGCYNDSIYLAGYSIELALKWKFCDKLQIDFPENFKDIKIHNLKFLLYLCGEELKLKQDTDWGVIINVIDWSEQIRYIEKNFTLQEAKDMINSCDELLKKLII
jgi:HEPN domain-containing protein